MVEWFRWGKLIALVYSVGENNRGYLANYKTIWEGKLRSIKNETD